MQNKCVNFIKVKEFIKKNPTRCNSISDVIIPYLYVVRYSMCLTTSTNYTYNQPSTYAKPEAASAVLGS
jgi:hypothetical protein